ncbi:MAG TPA: asparaginase [Azospirillaceae bacterium]|nr:asparaginase [Azospirillaceae bacterium]
MCPHDHDHDHHEHGHEHGPGCSHGHPEPMPAVRRVEVPGSAASPILVEVTRGNMVESVHRGRAVVTDADGRVVAQWGDMATLVYPRSSNKSLQAIPLVESGAADAFGLSDAEIALACASHNGEPMHTETVAAWLARVGLSADDLECGTHLPYHTPTTEAMLARGEAPTPLHNNCSGKHAGMLTTARHRSEPTRGYVKYHHPVQQRILGVLEQVTGQDLSNAPWGVDGCSIPTIGLPIGALALGMARVADPRHLPDRRAEAVTRIARAWARHPEMVSGTDTFDTDFMRACGSAVLTKAGAEGLCCAVLPEHGLGIAVKIDDGAGRAAGPAMAAVLRRLGVLPDHVWESVALLANPPITNRARLQVGEIRAAQAFLD